MGYEPNAVKCNRQPVKPVYQTKNMSTISDTTVIVLVSDLSYWIKGRRSVLDLRSAGQWTGPICYVSCGFDINPDFLTFYQVQQVKMDPIDKTHLLSQIGEGFPGSDGREIDKINQWDKLHAFDSYFLRWNRIIYVDAGTRVFHPINCLLEIDYKNSILTPGESGNLWGSISKKNPLISQQLLQDFGDEVLYSRVPLNGIWICDSNILTICTKASMIETMNKYPCFMHNEMTMMALLLIVKHKIWKALPKKCCNDLYYTFEWSEEKIPDSKWTDFLMLKYPLYLKITEP